MNRATFWEVVDTINALAVEHEMARRADARFDGGEFSGPAHDAAFERAMESALSAHGWTRDEYLDVAHRHERGGAA